MYVEQRLQLLLRYNGSASVRELSCECISELSVIETQKIVMNNRCFSIYTGTTREPLALQGQAAGAESHERAARGARERR